MITWQASKLDVGCVMRACAALQRCRWTRNQHMPARTSNSWGRGLPGPAMMGPTILKSGLTGRSHSAAQCNGVMVRAGSVVLVTSSPYRALQQQQDITNGIRESLSSVHAHCCEMLGRCSQ